MFMALIIGAGILGNGVGVATSAPTLVNTWYDKDKFCCYANFMEITHNFIYPEGIWLSLLGMIVQALSKSCLGLSNDPV